MENNNARISLKHKQTQRFSQQKSGRSLHINQLKKCNRIIDCRLHFHGIRNWGITILVLLINVCLIVKTKLICLH